MKSGLRFTVVAIATCLVLVSCKTSRSSRRGSSSADGGRGPYAPEQAGSFDESDPPPIEEGLTEKFVDLVVPIEGEDVRLQARFISAKQGPNQRPGVIFVPGSGNISFLGTRNGNGSEEYPYPVHTTALFADRFADDGFLALSYSKRTFQGDAGVLYQADIDAEGPAAMSVDVDAACELMRAQPNFDGRILLFASGQAGHVAMKSKCAQTASVMILVAPIPRAIDKVMVAGLNARAKALRTKGKASGDEALLEAASDLRNRAGSVEATFEAVAKKKFPDGTRIFGATAGFWAGWIGLTSEFQPPAVPLIIVRGQDDAQYAPEDRERIDAAAAQHNARLLLIEGKDHHLIPLDESTWLPILDAIHSELTKKDGDVG